MSTTATLPTLDLTESELIALRFISITGNSVDVFSPVLARTLHTLSLRSPQLVTKGAPIETYTDGDVRPFFSVTLTDLGRELAD